MVLFKKPLLGMFMSVCFGVLMWLWFPPEDLRRAGVCLSGASFCLFSLAFVYAHYCDWRGIRNKKKRAIVQFDNRSFFESTIIDFKIIKCKKCGKPFEAVISAMNAGLAGSLPPMATCPSCGEVQAYGQMGLGLGQ